MELGLTEDQEFFRETSRKFIEAEVPLARVRELFDEPAGFDRAWWKRAAEMGWTSMLVPEAYGGLTLAGEGLVDLSIVAEEVGRLVSPGPLLPTNLVAAAVAARGTPEQQQALLPGIVRGDLIAAWALLEPGARWRAEDVQLEALASGDDFLLRGGKAPVEAAAQADQLLVAARTAGGLTQFIVPVDTPGLSVQPMQSLDLVRRFSDVRFDDVRLPREAVLGEVDTAESDIERLIQIAIVIQCAETVGATDRVFETTLEYMFDRFSFGRPLASYQALKHRFADAKLWLEACHATAAGAARAVQEESVSARELVSSAKSYIGDKAGEIIQECVQMHGGMGVTWEHDIHLYLRRVTLNRALYGTPDQHRERIAVLLGMDDASEASP
jgi:alkylation response protein AidB-like acyl-CoA dehydrogenase